MGKKNIIKNLFTKEGTKNKASVKSKTIDVIKKYASGDYGPGDRKTKLSLDNELLLAQEENNIDSYIHSL